MDFRSMLAKSGVEKLTERVMDGCRNTQVHEQIDGQMDE